MTELARTLRDLYDSEGGGTAFALDGLVEADVLEKWLQLGVLGQTSNQTLFLAKVTAGLLDAEIAALRGEGRTPEEIFNLLYNQEAMDSARALERWVDARDSLAFSRETDATRAADGSAIAAEAQSIQAISPWLLVKLANVGPSPEAIRTMIRQAVEGGGESGRLVNPNITLVFGANHYINTVWGYIDGLESVAARGIDVSSTRSVNSLFVSRLDTAVDGLIDKQLETSPGPEDRDLLKHLRGKTAIAHAKKIYQMSRAIFLGEEFLDPESLFADLHPSIENLRERFARLDNGPIQRVLIASSGNKKSRVYSDLIYVLPFFGPHLGNTLPAKTLQILEDRLNRTGMPLRSTALDPIPWMIQQAETIEQWEEAVLSGTGTFRTADEILSLVRERVLALNGTSLTQISDDLRDKGAKAFSQDQVKAYEVFHEKVESLGVCRAYLI